MCISACIWQSWKLSPNLKCLVRQRMPNAHCSYSVNCWRHSSGWVGKRSLEVDKQELQYSAHWSENVWITGEEQCAEWRRFVGNDGWFNLARCYRRPTRLVQRTYGLDSVPVPATHDRRSLTAIAAVSSSSTVARVAVLETWVLDLNIKLLASPPVSDINRLYSYSFYKHRNSVC